MREYVVKVSSPGSRGTGFVIGQGLVATALHVVAERRPDGIAQRAETYVLEFARLNPGSGVWERHERAARILSGAWDLDDDWALLQFDHAELEGWELKAAGLARLREEAVKGQRLLWFSWGFPEAHPTLGMETGGHVRTVTAPLDAITPGRDPVTAIQLYSEEAAAALGMPVKGLSGAPVVVEGSVVGLLRYSLLQPAAAGEDRRNQAGTLYATPIERLRDPGGLFRWADSDRLPPLGLDECLPKEPYRLLERYEPEDFRIFFGRGSDIRQFLSDLKRTDLPAVGLLVGPMGAGKSSFLRAGIAARLTSNRKLHVVPRGPEGLLITWRTLEERIGSTEDLPVLDQLEEAWTAGRADDEFAELLQRIAEWLGARGQQRGLQLFLSFREDRLSSVEDELRRHGIRWHSFPLRHLDSRGLLETMTGFEFDPAIRDFYRIEFHPRGLPQTIVDAVLTGNPGAVAPVLQVLLSRLWARATSRAAIEGSAKRTITDTDFALEQEAARGLHDFLDKQLETVERRHPLSVRSGLALEILCEYTTAGGTGRSRRVEDLTAIYPVNSVVLIPSLVEALATAKLLFRERPGSHRLVHDSLAPVVQDSLSKSDRPAQRARRTLESRVVDWRNGAVGPVLDDAGLRSVESGEQYIRRFDNTADEIALLDASRKDRKRRKRTRIIIRVALSLAALLIVASAGIAIYASSSARRRASISEAQALAAQSEAAFDISPTLLERNVLLATESLRRQPLLEGDQALRRSLSLLGRRISRRGLQTAPRLIAMSPDGRYIAVTSGGTSLTLIDVASWTKSQFITDQPSTRTIEFSPDSRYIAAISGPTFLEGFRDRTKTGKPRNTLTIWDISTLSRIAALPFPREIETLRFNLHSDLLVAIAWDYAVSIKLSAPGNMNIFKLPGPLGELAISHKGNLMAFASGDNIVTLWNLDDKPPLAVKSFPLDVAGKTADFYVRRLCFSSDDSTIVAGRRDGELNAWRLKTGELTFRRRHPDIEVGAMACAPDGEVFASASRDKTVRLWNLSRQEEIGHLTADGAITRMFFTRDGSLVAAASEDGTVRVMSVANGQEVGRIVQDAPVATAAFLQETSRLVTATSRGAISIWDPLGKSWVLRVEGSRFFALSRDERFLAIGTLSGELRVLDLDGEVKELSRFKHQREVIEAAFNLEGGLVVSADYDLGNTSENRPPEDQLAVWSLKTGRRVRSLPLGGYFKKLWPAVSADGRLIAVSDDNRAMQIKAVSNFATLQVIPIPDMFVAFSSDGTLLLTKQGTLISKLSQDGRRREASYAIQGEAAVVSHDKRYIIAIKHDQTCELSRFPMGPLMLQMKSCERTVFSHDDRLVAAMRGKEVALWDIDRRNLVGVLRHDGEVKDVAFSSSGKYIATAGGDNTARIWDVQRQVEVTRLHDAFPIWHVGFGGGDRFLIVTSAKNWSRSYSEDIASTTVYMWQPHDLIDQACSRVTRNLRLDEWRRFLGIEARYECTCVNLVPGEGAPDRKCGK